MSETDESCGNCRYWLLLGATARCHRNAPRPVIAAESVHVYMHPYTTEDDWCGEWKPVKPAPPAEPGAGLAFVHTAVSESLGLLGVPSSVDPVSLPDVLRAMIAAGQLKPNWAALESKEI